MNPSAGFTYELEIPPAGVRPIVAPGNFFLITQANTPLEIQRTGAPYTYYEQGDWEELREGEFDRLEVKNTTAVTCYAKIYLGFGRRGQNRMAVMEPPTRARAIFAGNLTPGQVLPVGRLLGSGDIGGKAVLVYNGSAELRLYVLDEDGAKIAFVPPEQGHTFPVSHPLSVVNPHGVPVEAFISRINWTAVP